ncbi:MAG: LPS assembly lipoprotein LptE [Terriglobales bacterium]
MRPIALISALAPALVLAGCGYHLANHGGALPAATRVVAVVPFANHTRQPQLSQAISAAVAREFQQRAHYRIQTEAAGSDAAVHGDLLSVAINPVTFDATTGRATTAEVVLHLQVWVVEEPSGRELFRNNDLVFHDQYELSAQQAGFFEEDSTAFLRLSQSIAQTVVADILEAF